MTDHTKDLTDSEQLNLIQAELADVKTRLVSLESKVDERRRIRACCGRSSTRRPKR